MRHRKIVIATVVVLLIAGLVFLFLSSRVPALHLLVVNETGAPVKDAKIQPDGIRGTDGGHYGWLNLAVKPLPVTTDVNGRATIPYPRFIVERVRSIELSFSVEHPDYSSDRPFVKVASPIRSTTPISQRLQFIYEDFHQSGKTEKIVLKRGAAIELAARIGGRALPATDFHAQLVTGHGQFDGVFMRSEDRLGSKKVSPGNFMVRACARVDGTNYFSELLTLTAVAGETNVALVDLQPGHSVEGRLIGVDGSITNGWVNVRSLHQSAGEVMPWADFTEVQPDGTFRLSGLPPGRLEVVAICDGYLSANPTGASTFVRPHTFDLPGSDRIEIPMRPSAVANIRVLGPTDEPIAGAPVHFWPNIQWAGNWSGGWSTIFASDFYREIEALEQKDPLKRWERAARRSYTATTDKDGRAIIRELPPEALPFVVEHSQLEMPLISGQRQSSIMLTPGHTNFSAVKLQQKTGKMRD